MIAEPKPTPESDSPSVEKRRKSRREFDNPLNVFDAESGCLVGGLTNMTSSGLLLLSEHPIRRRAVLDVLVELPVPMDGREFIDLQMQCRWSHRVAGRSVFEAGFRFVNTTFRQKLLLETFLAQKTLEAAEIVAERSEPVNQ